MEATTLPSSVVHNIAAKLAPKYYEPFKIIKLRSAVVFEFARLDGSPVGKVHVKELKPYIDPYS